nr:MAG TPA: hypothetical protein [Caudoviricetes sp.]
MKIQNKCRSRQRIDSSSLEGMVVICFVPITLKVSGWRSSLKRYLNLF